MSGAVIKTPRTAEAGFSIVELMVALVLVAIFLAGVVELFVSSKRNSNAVEKLSELQETGRVAMQLITADIRRAGNYGGLAESADVTGSLPSVAAAGTCAANTTWGRVIDEPLFGIDDDGNTGAHAAYACLSDAEHLRGDVLTVRYVSSWPIAAASMQANRLYFRGTVMEGRIFAGSAQGNSANLVDDVSAESYALVAHSYYIGESGRTCNGEAIPALFRKTLSDTGLPVSEELLPGVEHLQFRYRQGDRLYDASSASIDWGAVTAVEVSVLIRSECAEPGLVNNRSFNVGNMSSAWAPADSYRREVFTTVSSLRNRV